MGKGYVRHVRENVRIGQVVCLITTVCAGMALSSDDARLWLARTIDSSYPPFTTDWQTPPVDGINLPPQSPLCLTPLLLQLPPGFLLIRCIDSPISDPTLRIESIVPPRTTHPRTMLACFLRSLPHTYPILSSLPCHATVRYLLPIPYYGERYLYSCPPPNYRPGPTHLPSAGDQITPSVAPHVCSRPSHNFQHCHHHDPFIRT